MTSELSQGLSDNNAYRVPGRIGKPLAAQPRPWLTSGSSGLPYQRLHKSLGDLLPVEFESLYVAQGVQLSNPS